MRYKYIHSVFKQTLISYVELGESEELLLVVERVLYPDLKIGYCLTGTAAGRGGYLLLVYPVCFIITILIDNIFIMLLANILPFISKLFTIDD